MLNWNIISAESEARRICDKRGITDLYDFQRVCASIRHRGFMESIQPFINQKVRINNMRMLSHIVVGADGQLAETVYKPLPVEAEQFLAELDRLIASEAVRWGFEQPNASATP